jgi:hypothetical protein
VLLMSHLQPSHLDLDLLKQDLNLPMICSGCVSFKNSTNRKKEMPEPELHGKSHEETMALLVD